MTTEGKKGKTYFYKEDQNVLLIFLLPLEDRHTHQAVQRLPKVRIQQLFKRSCSGPVRIPIYFLQVKPSQFAIYYTIVLLECIYE